MIKVRFDLHIVRTSRGWVLQNARCTTLSVFRDADSALEASRTRAADLQRRGLNARVTLHPPGKKAKVFEFPAAATDAGILPVESYALTCCRLS